MGRISVPIKVALGYVFVVSILGVSAWLVYDNTRTYVTTNAAERVLMQRRSVADSLVYSFLEMNNNESAVYFGMDGSWQEFDRSVTLTQHIADSLKTLAGDSLLGVKTDELVRLLERKRENTRVMMGMMSRGKGGSHLDSKLHDLHSGRDSLIIHPEGTGVRERRETVYEVVKTRKNFFGRLADAFRKSRNDTVSVRSDSGTLVADSLTRSVNIGDTVAGVLAEIKKAETEDHIERMAYLDRSEKDMQAVGMQLARRIRQILDNLLSNAIKYTFTGEVRVTAEVGGGRLLLKVSDTGQGMTPEESRRVFDAFTRLDGAQGIEGVGLGLSITRELVTLLGGNVSLRSVKGQGTTFTVTLPVDVSHASDGEPERNAAADKPAMPPCGSLDIIIVDDDKLQLQLLTEMLSRLSGGKWRLTVCRRIDEARRMLASSAYDILITDIEMPEMNGADFIRSIDRGGMAVVAMTAHDRSVRTLLEEAGFDGCLFKPFDMDTLAGVIMSVSGRKADAPAAAQSGDAGRFAPLTAFAAGDAGAEREILTTFASELSAQEKALRKAAEGADRAEAARVSHKALPVLTMINAAITGALGGLSSSGSASLSDQEFAARCTYVADGMAEIRLEVEALLRSVE